MSAFFESVRNGKVESVAGRSKLLCRWIAVGLFLFAALFVLQGCSGSPAKTGAQSQSDTETEHEDDHDHHDHDHHDPEHKPKSFPEAVERLKELRPDLSERIRPGSEDWEVVSDIVGWLPELAAESELNEREWNRVEGSASELRMLLELSTRDTTHWKQFDVALEKLNESVADYRAAEARFMRPMTDAETVRTPGVE